MTWSPFQYRLYHATSATARLTLQAYHNTKARMTQVHIIGGGLAGSEAAWQLAEQGVKARLSEMRGSGEMTPAHQTDALAELVCSNSFRSDDAEKNAVGLLHQEMRDLYRLEDLWGDAGVVQWES